MIAAALCISVGAQLLSLPTDDFTLRWLHTVEKIAWEEDYLVVGSWLFMTSARIRGSGAGMEPPPDAVLVDGAWHYRPADRWRREVKLARSEFGSDYVLCIEGRCRPMTEVAPGPVAATILRSCAAAGSP
jgi:hypothetical protein